MASDSLLNLILTQLLARDSLKQAWTNNKRGILARIVERAIKTEEETQIRVITELQGSICVGEENFAKGLLIEYGRSSLAPFYFQTYYRT